MLVILRDAITHPPVPHVTCNESSNNICFCFQQYPKSPLQYDTSTPASPMMMIFLNKKNNGETESPLGSLPGATCQLREP